MYKIYIRAKMIYLKILTIIFLFCTNVYAGDEKKAKTKVKDQFNIELQLEIKLLGFDEKTMDALTGKTIV